MHAPQARTKTDFSHYRNAHADTLKLLIGWFKFGIVLMPMKVSPGFLLYILFESLAQIDASLVGQAN